MIDYLLCKFQKSSQVKLEPSMRSRSKLLPCINLFKGESTHSSRQKVLIEDTYLSDHRESQSSGETLISQKLVSSRKLMALLSLLRSSRLNSRLLPMISRWTERSLSSKMPIQNSRLLARRSTTERNIFASKFLIGKASTTTQSTSTYPFPRGHSEMMPLRSIKNSSRVNKKDVKIDF